ncbi:hypothetical protein [Pedobacter sp.]
MINLRNLPFFAVGLSALLLGLLAFKSDCLVWTIIAVLFLIMGIAFRKQIDTADGGH